MAAAVQDFVYHSMRGLGTHKGNVIKLRICCGFVSSYMLAQKPLPKHPLKKGREQDGFENKQNSFV